MKNEIPNNNDYKYGFVTDIENFKAPKGLSAETIKFISKIKKEPKWMLDWRLKAFNRLKVLKEPDWQKPKYPKINYQDLYYYSAPKNLKEKPKSLEDVDPKLIETYNKLGIPLEEQKVLAGVAVDAVFDSVSVATTYKDELEKLGIIFCSISEAIKSYPELVKKYSQELSNLPKGENRSLPLPEILRDPDLFGGKEDRIPWVEKAFENAEAK